MNNQAPMHPSLVEQAQKVAHRKQIENLADAVAERELADPVNIATRSILDNLKAGVFRAEPAQDIEAENIFIAGALIDAFSVLDFMWLAPGVFVNLRNQIVWRAMLLIASDGESAVIEGITVRHALAHYKARIEKDLKLEYDLETMQRSIMEYQDFAYHGLNFQAIAAMLIEDAKLRSVESIAVDMLRASRKVGVTHDMITGTFGKKLRSLESTTRKTSVSTPHEGREVIERMKRKESVPFYKTGVQALDKMIKLRRKEHVMIAGRASDGKSVLAKQLILALCQQDRQEQEKIQDSDLDLFEGLTTKPENKPKPKVEHKKLRALVIFTEDTKENYHMRCLAELAMVPIEALLDGFIPANPRCETCKASGWVFDLKTKERSRCDCWRSYEHEFYARLEEGQRRYEALDIRIIDERLTSADLEKRIIEEYKKAPFDVVCADYIQRFTVMSGQSKFEMVSAVSNILTDIAKNTELNPHGLIVISAVQINRAGANDANSTKDYIPQAHHLKDSGDLEQDAHIILAVSRNFNPDGSKSNLGKIFLLKYRNGSVEKPPLGVSLSGKYMRFDALDTLHV